MAVRRGRKSARLHGNVIRQLCDCLLIGANNSLSESLYSSVLSLVGERLIVIGDEEMKLAEALIERKGVKEQVDSLRERMQNMILVQEGDTPAESPEELSLAFSDTVARLEALIHAINDANHRVHLANGQSLAKAIVSRDMMRLRRQALEQIVSAATTSYHRFSRSEVKFVTTMDVRQLRKEMDLLAKQWRELDAEIQAVNWSTELSNPS